MAVEMTVKVGWDSRARSWPLNPRKIWAAESLELLGREDCGPAPVEMDIGQGVSWKSALQGLLENASPSCPCRAVIL